MDQQQKHKTAIYTFSIKNIQHRQHITTISSALVSTTDIGGVTVEEELHCDRQPRHFTLVLCKQATSLQNPPIKHQRVYKIMGIIVKVS